MKKKIMFFLESLKGGGAEKVLLDIVRKLDIDKYEIYVRVVTNNGIYDEEIKKYCQYSSILDTSNYKASLLRKIGYICKYKLVYKLPSKIVYQHYVKENVDFLVGFVEGFPTKIVANEKRANIKKIAWVHVDPLERDYADKYFSSNEEQQHTYEKFTHVICVSHSVEEAFMKKWGIYDNVFTQYNPVDRQEIMKLAEQESRAKKLWKKQFVASGRLVRQKGFDRLINVMHRLKESSNKDFGLIILGEGEERKNLEEKIKKYQLEDCVKLMGFQKNPYPYVRVSDVLVCSSRAEGYSLVIAEAMILGVGIISTNCSGPNELLDEGKYGFLVDNAEDAIFDAMLSLIKCEKLIEDLRAKAILRSECFDADKICKEIEKKFF